MQILNSQGQFTPPLFEVKKKTEFKNWRDEIISLMTDDINHLRKGTAYKPVTKRQIAIRANKNPFLVNDGELNLVYKECSAKGNYSKFFWVTK